MRLRQGVGAERWSDHLVQNLLMPSTSASWNESLPMAVVGTWPVKTTSGMPSLSASCMGVIVLVAPGPLVTSTTPGLPLALA